MKFLSFEELDDTSATGSALDGIVEKPKSADTVNMVALTPVKPDPDADKMVEEVQSEVLFGPRLDPEKFPELEAKVVLVEDQHQKVVDLSEIEQMIAGSKTISQESARLVEENVGGLFNNHLQLNHFTRTPSSVNLNYTQQFLKSRVAVESQAFFDTAKQTVDYMECFISDLLTEGSQGVRAIVRQRVKDMGEQLAAASVTTCMLFKGRTYEDLLKNETGDFYGCIKPTDAGLRVKFEKADSAASAFRKLYRDLPIQSQEKSTWGDLVEKLKDGRIVSDMDAFEQQILSWKTEVTDLQQQLTSEARDVNTTAAAVNALGEKLAVVEFVQSNYAAFMLLGPFVEFLIAMQA